MERLLCDKIIYSQKLRDDLNNLNFKPHLYKQVRNIIFLTVILGGMFAWASASEPTKESPGSNIYGLINKTFPGVPYSVVFFTAILILLSINLMAFIPSTKEICGKLSICKFENDIFQKELYIKFIRSQISELASEKSDSREKIFELYNSEHQDVEFTKNDFYKFCLAYFKNYITKVPSQFIDDISELILINELIDGTLVVEEKMLIGNLFLS